MIFFLQRIQIFTKNFFFFFFFFIGRWWGVEREGGARVCVLFSQRIQILYNKIKNIFFCSGEVEGGGGGGGGGG